MAISTRSQIIQNLAAGKGQMLPFQTTGTASGTGGTSTSGFFSLRSGFNTVGQSLPGTRMGVPAPDTTTQSLMVNFIQTTTSNKGGFFGRFYELGTLNLATAPGDNFVHAGTFTSISRTIYGEATKPITMIPVIYVTTALTGFAAVIEMATTAGGNGYTNQSATGVIGTKDFTFPSATTAVQSMFILPVEIGDCGVQDIIQIRTITAATAGVITVFGFEPIAPHNTFASNSMSNFDAVFSGSAMMDLEPGVPNAGSVTSYLGFLGTLGNNAAATGLAISVRN